MSVADFHEPAGFPPTPKGQVISNFMYMIWQTRPDLQDSFDLSRVDGRERFIAWYRDAAPREYRVPALVPREGQTAPLHSPMLFRMKAFVDRVSWIGRWIPRRIRRILARIWMALAMWLGKLSWRLGGPEKAVIPGVTLVGYANGILSLGEHLRTSAAAFEAVGQDFGILDFKLGTKDRQMPAGRHSAIIKNDRFSVNLFHVNADQMLQAYCHLGPGFFEGRYNIGYWAWELERFPKNWAPLISMLDEVWAPSRFVQAAIAAVTDKPVILMPQSIEIPAFSPAGRAAFGLDERFYYLFAFDFLSFIERKNPAALIKAFKTAFPTSRERVGLVLKVMNGDEGSGPWRDMLDLIAGDERIVVMNERMSRSESLSLWECCDCFVSLHRSEGFGRGIAEAMALGKSVIATAYSGNTDFARPDNSFQVDYRLVPVGEGQYVFGEGQVWAEPMITNAAAHMRTVFDDRERAAVIARKGQDYVREHLSARVTGAAMTARLRSLGLI